MELALNFNAGSIFAIFGVQKLGDAYETKRYLVGSCLWVVGCVYGTLCVTGGFAKVNTAYPYLAGFAQFAVYATAGELLSGRLLRELGRSTGRLGSKA